MGQRVSFPRSATITVPTKPTANTPPIQRKALLIEINYTGSENQMSDCINDVINIKRFLTDEYGMTDDDIKLL